MIKIAYFKRYGHKGNKTTAIIPRRIVGNNQVLGYAKSNLNVANFDLALP